MTIGFVVFSLDRRPADNLLQPRCPYRPPGSSIWGNLGTTVIKIIGERRAPSANRKKKSPVHIRMSRLKRNYEWDAGWRFEERGGAVLFRCMSLALGLGRLILEIACVFCWIFGVWVCVQTDGSRHLAITIVVRVLALSSLGSSFLPHCFARVLRGFSLALMIFPPVLLDRGAGDNSNTKSNNAIDHQDFYALHSFLFLSLL